MAAIAVGASGVGCAPGQEGAASPSPQNAEGAALHIPREIQYAPSSPMPVAIPGSRNTYLRVTWVRRTGELRGYCVSADRAGSPAGTNCFEADQIAAANAIQVVPTGDGRFDTIGLVPDRVTHVRVIRGDRVQIVPVDKGVFSLRSEEAPDRYEFDKPLARD